ncbi:hypothetical protein [Jiulongibacter sediminis]|uniref:hypothetical protein n=1 Tax=Jiulongibacter sediminis TaxID=1605367 RepID=UPI0026EFD1A0|nr:hypothetical protein [Jiulongibacter sediminis]
MMKFLSRVLIALLVLTGISFNASAWKTDLHYLDSELQQSSLQPSEENGFHFKVYSSDDREESLLITEETDEEEKNHLFEASGNSKSAGFHQSFSYKGGLEIIEASNRLLRSQPFLNLGSQKSYLLFEVFRL